MLSDAIERAKKEQQKEVEISVNLKENMASFIRAKSNRHFILVKTSN